MQINARILIGILWGVAITPLAVSQGQQGGDQGTYVIPFPDSPAAATPVRSGTVSSGGAGSPAELVYQLELLQQEVQELRGIVEQQTYQINQMRDEQRDRYLDLDRRISALSQGSAPQSAAPVEKSASAAPISRPNVTPAFNDEQGEYQAAFNLIRDKKYDQATAALNGFAKKYPDGSLTPNAYYWLGEVHLVKADYEPALQAFGLLLNRYPQHRKVPDAKYKLGTIYRSLGDSSRASAILREVVDQHPGSSAARLAESELRNL